MSTASPGKRLREAREAQGRTLSESAKATRIGVQQLEGIENDNYDRIPAPIYVKGFIKNYAQHLGLDPEPLLEAAERILEGGDPAAPPAPATAPVPEPEAEETPSPLRPDPGQKVSVLQELREKMVDLTKRLPEVQLPLDRRLLMIAGTVLVILLLVFGLRSCGGSRPPRDVEQGEIPVERLETLLIATPEPILFELPQTTP